MTVVVRADKPWQPMQECASFLNCWESARFMLSLFGESVLDMGGKRRAAAEP